MRARIDRRCHPYFATDYVCCRRQKVNIDSEIGSGRKYIGDPIGTGVGNQDDLGGGIAEDLSRVQSVPRSLVRFRSRVREGVCLARSGRRFPIQEPSVLAKERERVSPRFQAGERACVEDRHPLSQVVLQEAASYVHRGCGAQPAHTAGQSDEHRKLQSDDCARNVGCPGELTSGDSQQKQEQGSR